MDRLFAAKSEDVGLIVRAISFQDFQSMWSQITNVTDGRTDRRTDRRHAIARPRKCTKVHCAVKIITQRHSCTRRSFLMIRVNNTTGYKKYDIVTQKARDACVCISWKYQKSVFISRCVRLFRPIYSKNNHAKSHPYPIWNDRAWIFWRALPNKKK